MKVYLVHRGFAYDKEIKKPRPCGPVTYRLEKSDAESVADLLNEKLHELRYFEFLASQSNEALGGDKKSIIDSDTAENRQKIAELRAEAEKDAEKASLMNFSVTELSIVGDDEVKLKEELEKLKKKGE